MADDSPFDIAKTIGFKLSPLVSNPIDMNVLPNPFNLAQPSPANPNDPYADVSITGLNFNSEIAYGEQFTDGLVQIENGYAMPVVNLNLAVNDDPRYLACLKEANKLKQEYPLANLNPNNPEDYKIIVNNEEHITTELTKVIHQQYGDYNKDVAKELDKNNENVLYTAPSLHGETAQFTSWDEPPVDMKEFNKGELICVHYSSLLSTLATQAGLKNFLVLGHVTNVSKDGNVIDGDEHMFVVSRQTGAILEGTADKPEDSYHQRANSVSVQEFLAGKSLAVVHANGHASVYGTLYTGSPQEQKTVEDRLAFIQNGEWNKLASVGNNDVSLKQDIAEYDASVGSATQRMYTFLGGVVPSYNTWAKTQQDFTANGQELQLSDNLYMSISPLLKTGNAKEPRGK